ncbi:MAG: hypothetical protein ABR503_06715 [Chitinophagaceae bacterium]
MKKVTAILFLFIFCVQAFSFKTHYCYHTDGTRFHGDCTEHMEKAEYNSHSNASFHEQKYVCSDVTLDKQFQAHYTFKKITDAFFILTHVPELPVITSGYKRQALALFSCRGGPPIMTSFLRGPPLV